MKSRGFSPRTAARCANPGTILRLVLAVFATAAVPAAKSPVYMVLHGAWPAARVGLLVAYLHRLPSHLQAMLRQNGSALDHHHGDTGKPRRTEYLCAASAQTDALHLREETGVASGKPDLEKLQCHHRTPARTSYAAEPPDDFGACWDDEPTFR